MALKNVHAAIDRSPVVASCCLHDDCSRYAGQCCRNLRDQTERWVKSNQTIELTQCGGKITGTFRGRAGRARSKARKQYPVSCEDPGSAGLYRNGRWQHDERNDVGARKDRQLDRGACELGHSNPGVKPQGNWRSLNSAKN
jgi:hypothetical protein